jgi:parallel beta-helix repeat protein
VVIPRLDCLVAFNGAKHITLSGFTFTATTGGDDFHPHSVEGVGAMFPMKGWKYCGQAVLFRGAEHCCIQDSSFYGVGGNAVYLEGYNLRNAVRRNRIDHAGACGVGLAGAKSQNQYPLFNEIVGNRINHSGTMNNYSAGIFAGLSEGNVIGHNAIHDVPHHAINLGNSGFSRNIVEYNDVRRTCLETSDTGAINCWMEDTSQTSQRQGHVIRYNRVVDSPERGLYMDNDTSNCFVYGNVFLRCGQAILVHGGKNNVIENNVIVRCQAGIWYANWINSFIANMLGFQTGNRFCHNIVYDVKNALNPSSTMTDRTVAQSDQNLFFKTADADSYLRDWRKAGFEMHSLIADPLFVDPAHEDFRLRPESPAFKLGFQAIDFAKIGPGGSD